MAAGKLQLRAADGTIAGIEYEGGGDLAFIIPTSGLPTNESIDSKADKTDTYTKSEVDTALNTKVPTTRTVAGKALSANITLVKGDVGLANVDNTSDVNKPVSTLQQDALNLKANLAGGNTFTGNQTINGQITGSAVTQSSTDATGGRLLKVGDFGVGAPVKLPSGADLDTFTTNGVYDVDGAVNKPTGSVPWGYLRVIRHINANTHCYQEWTELTGANPRTYFRIQVAGTWTPWREIYHTGNFTGGASTITTANLTASRALVSDANGKVAVSGVTSTQLGHLSDVTSAIQTQLNAKQATLVSGTNIKTVNGTSILGSGDIVISASPTTAQVGTATAGLSVGAVGSYAFLQTTAASNYDAGTTLAGSSLRYAGTLRDISGQQVTWSSGTPSGTWRLMGYSTPSGGSLWLRIS